ncbi:2-amino-4-hydroxy-6-hydroxymethyldihydropteridine diphosphokinase [Pseudomonas sp. N040]|uniref:2-amino-4-hydroxy-6- hydroxymethyldihydropteridine diphosphokinase n=1 Tax=Pseudomonas sp. N040 TaxID=2785325 RepID=UPI0018A3205C|nr:2-amino-4-hydroxy-6-hydroxymethyldihydropteridine diphosphokinase [Pseudomonas sp. N040]MBF7728500.1 2-amino-4-hydroxy-6-hydroxymethyldihydropteridine diphosphokinase [Pseudomonas sp. N040]MBW7012140.1 2-amino-4-hydroxy-6-hydroxymethyldihydropteridine diphosphokinase [Pseudomonas sp. N040]
MSLTPVFLGLGSNIEREAHLLAGLEALAALLPGLRCSPVFESAAVGIKSGPFFNLVVMAQTDLSLAELDHQLKRIEAENGRYAAQRKGLPLDIDILLYGSQVGVFEGLLLPREEILRNAFVLWPLALLEPEGMHPGVGRSFAELWRTAQIEQHLCPVPFAWRGRELTPATLLQSCATPANAKKPD